MILALVAEEAMTHKERSIPGNLQSIKLSSFYDHNLALCKWRSLAVAKPVFEPKFNLLMLYAS